MKIVIDCRMYGYEFAGIGRYIINLINQIAQLDHQNQYYLLFRKKYYQSIKFTQANIHPVLADYRHYSFSEQVLLSLQLIRLKPDLVHFPHFNAPILYFGKQVLTIHDLIKNESRGQETTTKNPLFYWPKYLIYRSLIWINLKKANQIITPSHYWQDYLVKHYQIKKNKITVTYEGADEFQNLKTSTNIIKQLNIKKPYLLYVGNLYPHKNVERLVEATELINQRIKIKLVIVCPRNEFFKRFEQKIVQEKLDQYVQMIGFLKTDQISALYHHSEALIFPSLLEGFGLPGLEAMVSGTPVVAAKASCLPEVYGPAAIYFDPYNIKEMANNIIEVLTDQSLRKKLIDLGYRQVKKYSWQKMAKQTIAIYESCFSL